MFLLLLDGLDASALADAQSIQEVLVWIIGALIFVLLAVVGWHIKTLSNHKIEIKDLTSEHKAELKDLTDKREKDHAKMMKLALKVQSALQIWAGIEEDLTEESA